jgi:hypothetical protein
MKKFICLLLISIVFFSCEKDDTAAAKEFYLPVDHVSVPDTVSVGQTTTITVTYHKPSSCYIFNGYTTENQNYTRTICVRAIVFNESDCLPTDAGSFYNAPLTFTPAHAGNYTFKFWAGNDAYQQPIYIEHDIVVENNI